MSTSPARDDLFTLIHKALRAGLFAAATEAGFLEPHRILPSLVAG